MPSARPLTIAQPGVAQRRGERLGGELALRRGVAAADDRYRRPIEQFEPAFDINQWRWIGGLQQCLRILGVGQRHYMIVGVCEPGFDGCEIACKFRRPVWRRRPCR